MPSRSRMLDAICGDGERSLILPGVAVHTLCLPAPQLPGGPPTEANGLDVCYTTWRAAASPAPRGLPQLSVCAIDQLVSSEHGSAQVARPFVLKRAEFVAAAQHAYHMRVKTRSM